MSINVVVALMCKALRGIERRYWGVSRRIARLMLNDYCRLHHVSFDPQTTRWDGYATLSFHPESKVSIGHHFRIVSARCIGMENSTYSKIVAHKGGKICIGHHVGMTNVSINCHESIAIGNWVNIGAGCLIVDSDFHSLDWRDRMDGKTDIMRKRSKPVRIGDHAFIGARSIILKGVSIGDRSIIGAGSVVSSNVPDGEIWAGNPARFIKRIT